MNRILSRSLAAVAIATVAAGGSLIAQSSAFAVTDTATIAPLSGGSLTLMSMKTTGGCPTGVDTVTISVNGPAFSVLGDTIVTGATPISAVGGVGLAKTYNLAISNNWDNIRSGASLPAITAGSYTFTFSCIDTFGAGVVKTYFATQTVTADMTPTLPGAWNMPVVVVGTSTTVSATPASPAFGAPVAISSVVTQASGSAKPTGSVQFSDASGNIGSPVAVDAAGNASLTTSTLSSGAHNISAAFTGTGGFSNSASTAAATVTVGAAPAGPTTTVLTVSPSAVFTTSSIVLSASEAPSVAGSFVFSGFPGGPTAPIAASSGAATFTVGVLPAGSYSFVATFTPTNLAANTASSDTKAVTVSAGAPATQVGIEFVEVTVSNGTLNLTVQGFPTNVASPTTKTVGPPTNIVFLSNAVLNASATLLTATGNIIPVVVTDTRAGNLGYVVTGHLEDFTGPAGVINAQNVGWVPAFVSSSRGADGITNGGLVDGGVTAAANGVAAAAPGILGLKDTPKLFTALPGHSNGQVVYGAALDLKAPTSTLPGAYEAVLTLTAS